MSFIFLPWILISYRVRFKGDVAGATTLTDFTACIHELIDVGLILCTEAAWPHDCVCMCVCAHLCVCVCLRVCVCVQSLNESPDCHSSPHLGILSLMSADQTGLPCPCMSRAGTHTHTNTHAHVTHRHTHIHMLITRRPDALLPQPTGRVSNASMFGTRVCARVCSLVCACACVLQLST